MRMLLAAAAALLSLAPAQAQQITVKYSGIQPIEHPSSSRYASSHSTGGLRSCLTESLRVPTSGS